MGPLSRRLAVGLMALCTTAVAAGVERKNHFDDPFVQVTAGLASCPVPEGPLITEQERRAESHWRVERGTSCFRSGRCRLPNAYRYDAEIVPRVRRFIERSGRFADTSVWVTGRRRWVYLDGCVRSKAEAKDLANAVRGIDDVEAVVDRLSIGTSGRPAYRVAGQAD